jgi:hypothetical protein
MFRDSSTASSGRPVGTVREPAESDGLKFTAHADSSDATTSNKTALMQRIILALREDKGRIPIGLGVEVFAFSHLFGVKGSRLSGIARMLKEVRLRM